MKPRSWWTLFLAVAAAIVAALTGVWAGARIVWGPVAR